MIETRYIDYNGLMTRNEMAGQFNNDINRKNTNYAELDESNDQEVEDLLLRDSWELECYLRNTVYPIDVEIDKNGNVVSVPLEKFQSALEEVADGHETFLIKYLIDYDLISTINFSACNDDLDEVDFSLIIFNENDKFTYFVVNKYDEYNPTMSSVAIHSIHEVEEAVELEFYDLGLDENIKLGADLRTLLERNTESESLKTEVKQNRRSRNRPR
ncbi:hypothetical protein OTK51_13295 [Vibrio scophthalmi]|uniref:hypothetical protein n=1 Tax=Vibrio scophthalmi TaxID=45658 RepID=UPI0022848A40|nr:hypothetical protein [Vibrio scophthalmi]MCY9804403.1 hypothetical protein [Vibrio scophthalmi]